MAHEGQRIVVLPGRDLVLVRLGKTTADQQPAMDDYGYGDPGYSDPSYEGPKTPYGNPALPADHGTSHGNGRGNAGSWHHRLNRGEK